MISPRAPHRRWCPAAAAWLLLAGGWATGQAAEPSATPDLPITRISDIRALDREQASQKTPVRVRGVVQWVGGRPQDDFILADASASIYVVRLPPFTQDQPASPGGRPVLLHPGPEHIGLEVEVAGLVNSGGYTPIIQYRNAEILGPGKPLPVKPVTIAHLEGGSEDGQRVELEKVVVQSVVLGSGSNERALRVCDSSGNYAVLIVRAAAWNEPEKILDAEARVRGTVLALHNSRAEQTGVRVAVPSEADFEIVKPPAPDPFAVPKVAVGALTPFRPQGLSPHRRLVEGTVTLVSPDEMVIQDGECGVEVKYTSSTGLQVGDRVLLSGFVEVRKPVAYLTNALVKKLSAGAPPAPAPATVKDILVAGEGNSIQLWGRQPEDFDYRLVRLRGTLIGRLEAGAAPFTLQTDTGENVTCRFASGSSGFSRPLKTGSLADVTGVSLINYAPGTSLPELLRPAGVELLLRGADDVRIVRAPSWWTARRLGIALGTVMVVLAIVAAWVLLLRRTVTRQARHIETALRAHRNTELEHRAANRERLRVAGDLHDGVHQLLNAASYRLESVANLSTRDPSAVIPHVQAAQKILARSQHEMRSVMWGLHVLGKESQDFAKLLAQSLAGMDHWPPGAVVVTGAGAPQAVPARAAGSLLLLVQEAVQNALSHGRATRVEAHVDFTPEALRLTIRDNGSGFDPAQPEPTAHGGLGLGSMKSRADELEGTFHLTSAPDQGTTILVVLPWDKLRQFFPATSPSSP